MRFQRRLRLALLGIVWSLCGAGTAAAEAGKPPVPSILDPFPKQARLGVRQMDFTPDGRLLALSSGKQVQIRQLGNLKLLRTITPPGRGDQILSMALSPDGSQLAIACFTNITIWSLSDGKLRCKLPKWRMQYSKIRFGPKGRTLLVLLARDRVISVRETQTGKTLRTIRLPGSALWKSGLNFDAKGHLVLALSDREGLLRILRLNHLTGKVLENRAPAGIHRSAFLGFGPGTKTLLQKHGDEARVIRRSDLWELCAPKMLDGHSGHGLLLSPDERWLLRVGTRWMSCWRANGEQKAFEIKVQAYLGSVRFTPDGKRLLAGVGRKLYIWDLSKQRATPLVHGPLTRQAKMVAPNDPPARWIFDPVSGRIFASLFRTGHLAEFDASGKLLEKIRVGLRPRELAIKGRKLLVLCHSKPITLHVLDLTGEQDPIAISLPGQKARSLFCSQRDNDLAYVVADPIRGRERLIRIDLRRRTVDQKESPLGYRVLATMTASGRWLASFRTKYSSRVELFRVDEPRFRFQLHARTPKEVAGVPQVGPGGNSWLFGERRYPIGLGKQIGRRFPGYPTILHPSLDLSISVLRKFSTSEPSPLFRVIGLAVEQASTGRRLATYRLDCPEHYYRNQREATDPLARLQLDLRGERVFFEFGKRAALIDLSHLELKGLPSVPHLVAPPWETQASVGNQVRIPIGLTRPDLAAGCSFSMTGPKGARLVQGRLVWTPGPQDLGLARFRVTVKQGKLQDATHFTVRVWRHAPLIVDRRIIGLSCGRDGKRCLIQLGRDHNQKQPIELIDLTSGKRIARVTPRYEVSGMHLGQRAVYLADVKHRLSILDRKTLKLRGQVYIKAGKPRSLVELPRNQVGLADGSPLMICDATRARIIYREPKNRFDRSRFSPPVTLGLQNGLRFMSQVYDDSGKLRMLSGCWLFPLVNQPRATGRRPTLWQRELVRYGANVELRVSPGKRAKGLADWSARAAIILRRYPAVVSLRESSTEKDRVVIRAMFELQFRDLIRGKLIHSIRLIDGPPVPLPHAKLRGLPQPLHIRNRISAISVALGRSVRLTVAAAGGKPPYRFKLTEQAPWLKIDAKTGAVTVDTSRVVADFRLQLNRLAQREDSRRRQLDEQLALIRRGPAEFARVTGKQTTDYPLAVSLDLSVTDATGAVDQRAFTVLVMVPRALMSRMLARAETAYEDEWLAKYRAKRFLQRVPVLWKIESKGKRPTYLLGVIGQGMQPAQLARPALRAFLRSQHLVVEWTKQKDIKAAWTSATELPEGKTLRAMLTGQDWTRLNKQLDQIFAVQYLLKRRRPWSVFELLFREALPGARSERRKRESIRAAFEQLGRKSGKTVHGLWLPKKRVFLLEQRPSKEWVAQLHRVLNHPARYRKEVRLLLRTYMRGDVSGLTDLLTDVNGLARQPQPPATAKAPALLTEALIPHIKRGNTLVVLDAADLLGDRGVLALLGQQGYQVVRVKSP